MDSTLSYPFDTALLSRKRRSRRAELLAGGSFTDVKIAILGGSTTVDVEAFLELFLLGAGIRPSFYVSDYNRYYEEAVVDGASLRAFAPDVVFVHTTHRNVQAWPPLLADEDTVATMLAAERERFVMLWTSLLEHTDALVIQNNFDPPMLEPLGHLGASCHYGRAAFLLRLNASFAAYACKTPRLRINDIHTVAARLGLRAWASERDWFLYRKAITPEGSAHVGHAVARTVRAAYGKSKKCLVLDLDDTLWGGVVGEDGMHGLVLGHDTAEGEAYLTFQRYCLALKERGVLLAVCSKNDDAVARSGFSHPDSVLHLEDFSAFVANWRPKTENLRAIAQHLGIGLDALVFVDDNPRERALVEKELPEVATPNVGDPTAFAEVLDREGWFEPFTIGPDDQPRAAMMAASVERAATASEAQDYDAYLASLEMEAEIAPFVEPYLARIAQLVNKTNQFNLTTKRVTDAQVARMAQDPEYVTLYGRLRDRFGDSGLVSVVVGREAAGELHIELWLMSCRVLKRDLELAMFDALLDAARARGVHRLVGHYVPTPKNGMVAEHYASLGFSSLPDGRWGLDLDPVPAQKNHHIRRTNSHGRLDPATPLADLPGRPR